MSRGEKRREEKKQNRTEQTAEERGEGREVTEREHEQNNAGDKSKKEREFKQTNMFAPLLLSFEFVFFKKTTTQLLAQSVNKNHCSHQTKSEIYEQTTTTDEIPDVKTEGLNECYVICCNVNSTFPECRPLWAMIKQKLASSVPSFRTFCSCWFRSSFLCV